MIPSFEYYLKNGEARKTRVRDLSRAKSLLETAKERMKEAERIKIPAFKIEFAYEALLEIIEAILSVDGYKTYSHVACLAYLRVLNFSEDVIEKVNVLRVKRHKSKYYGIKISESESKELFKISKNVFCKLENIICKRISEFSKNGS